METSGNGVMHVSDYSNAPENTVTLHGDFTMNAEGDGNHQQILPETVQELGEKWPLSQQDNKRLFETFKALYATKTRD